MKKRLINIVMILLIGVMLVSQNMNLSYGEEVQVLEQYDIYIDGEIVKKDQGYIINGSLYISVDTLKKNFINDGLNYDEENKKLTVDFSNKEIKFEDTQVDYFVKGNMTSFYVPMRRIESENYIPINQLKSFLKIEYKIEGNKILLTTMKEKSEGRYGKIVPNEVKVKPSFLSVKSLDLKLKKDAEFEIIDETKNYFKVITEDNITCYIKKKDVSLVSNEITIYDYYSKVKTKKNYGGEKINLLWEYVYALTPKPFEEKNGGVDIVSPTWFYINDADGNLVNKADKGYVEKSHENGYEVWGLVTNKFDGNLTTQVLQNEAAVNKVIAQLVMYASLYDLDGINVDFECVKDSDRDALTKFMRKLDYYMEKEGLVLSIDVMIPTPWTIEYDRSELSKIVDYVMVMTYDEHWRTGPEDGSIASYPWVEKAIVNTLKEVDKEKIIMGIPLYTRVWEETVTNGVIKRTNRSISMAELKTIIKDNGYEVKWLDNEKQYYVEFVEGDKTSRSWIEDARSIAYKLSIIEKYDIGGSACWRRGFEEEAVWEVFKGVFKDGLSSTTFFDTTY